MGERDGQFGASQRDALGKLSTAHGDALKFGAIGAIGLSEPLEKWSRTAARLAHDAAMRALDILVASVLLIAVAPICLLVALAIKLESPGPVLYRARRVGQHGLPFEMLKFRKMRDDARGIPLTTASDDRFTRVGAFLTKTKLDELPQLVNVVKGEMSLVGPRPEVATFVDMHPDRFSRILERRPGVTGLSQLAFAEENAILDTADPIGHYCGRILPQKMHLDELYATTATTWTNLYVLSWTVIAVILRRRVAVFRSTGQMRLRVR